MLKLSELKISPAPWVPSLEKDYIPIDRMVLDNREVEVCTAKGDSYKQAMANATFIAAEPELYERAWELVSAFYERVMTPEHVEALRAALAKAAGEELKSNERENK